MHENVIYHIYEQFYCEFNRCYDTQHLIADCTVNVQYAVQENRLLSRCGSPSIADHITHCQRQPDQNLYSRPTPR